ncbi:E3 ubiquitin-protein ligase Praja-2 [Pleurodeles waltl]|uniref:E3 ubiquitin-protein ligase Praja-2 n=1 Tax=Pleurodeles waltl TaxID=8319 RepID=UPI00370974B0
MGQEAGKPAWPKPAGGYQTITGRRYGRRHAYVSFRPSLANSERTSSPQSRECEGLELDDVQKDNPLWSSESSSPVIPGPYPSFTNRPCLQIVKPEASVCGGLVSPTKRSDSVYSAVRRTGTDQRTLSRSYERVKVSQGYHVQTSETTRPNGITLVNIDSYEPESSEGEFDGEFTEDCFSLTEEEGKLRKTLDHMLLELEKDVETLSGLQSYLPSLNHRDQMEDLETFTSSPLSQSTLGMDLTPLNNERTLQRRRSTAEADVSPRSVNSITLNCEVQQNNKPDSSGRNTLSIYNDLNTTDKSSSSDSSELVVRPKIRKQSSGSQIDKKKQRTSEEEQKGEEHKKKIRRWEDSVEDPPGRSKAPLRTANEKMQDDMFFDPRDYLGAQEQPTDDLEKQDKGAEKDKNGAMDEATFWEDFESYSRNVSSSSKDDNSSYCSDGEWSTCLPPYFTAENSHSSSDDSWETLPSKDQEPELQSNSSGVEEEQSHFCFQEEEQPSFEEGEIPWLQYHEEIESSSDEENEPVSQFVHPGFFMLDGNNNLEDDSSMSEDLDVEWRLLDEFGDGIGVAQAISYVDPQFLTYMALEERLAQAMETALAHLESLSVDVEQAHPPASKESIDCLPQVIITEDHNAVGQEQCCAICCSEYIKEEVLTELPCRHFFHKPCVTVWLQKSGTCPVCRHVLTPVVPEAAAATSFLSDHESPPSIHSAAGTR